MAYGRWNQEIGRMNCTRVEIEKREIYENDIVNQALLNIQFCHETRPSPMDNGYHLSINISGWSSLDLNIIVVQ